MKTALSLLVFLSTTLPALAGPSAACRAAIASQDYAQMCRSCHRLPVTKRECLEHGNFERARDCFLSLGDVISFHGPAIYRACYTAPDAERVRSCASLKYHSRQYYACVR